MTNKLKMLVCLRVLQARVFLPLHLFMMTLCWVLSPILPLFINDKGQLPRWLNWFHTPDQPDINSEGQFNHLPLYLAQMLWLIRNPAYGFAWSVLACEKHPRSKLKVYGDIMAKDHPFKQGWSFAVDPEGYFSFRLYWRTLPDRCLKLRLGWKIYFSTPHVPKCKFVFTCNPFKSTIK